LSSVPEATKYELKFFLTREKRTSPNGFESGCCFWERSKYS